MNIVILGPQGSGKGTQARLLAQEYGLFYFETGSFLRQIAKTNPRIDELVNKEGVLVPDEEVFELVTRFLEQEHPSADKILFDGYPRSVQQYNLLKKWLGNKNLKINLVIFLDISEEESVKRLSARRVCEKCGKVYNLVTNPPASDNCSCGGKLIHRDDDKPETVKMRLKLYRETTQPLLEIIAKEGILFRVNGERPIGAIADELKNIIERVGNGNPN